MSPNIALHLDQELQQLSLQKAAVLELRACCICGAIKRADNMEECLKCDGFMCATHPYAEHACDFSTETSPKLANKMLQGKTVIKKK